MARSKKPAAPEHDNQDKAFANLLTTYSDDVQKLYKAVRALVHKLVPDALEEIDVRSP